MLHNAYLTCTFYQNFYLANIPPSLGMEGTSVVKLIHMEEFMACNFSSSSIQSTDKYMFTHSSLKAKNCTTVWVKKQINGTHSQNNWAESNRWDTSVRTNKSVNSKVGRSHWTALGIAGIQTLSERWSSRHWRWESRSEDPLWRKSTSPPWTSPHGGRVSGTVLENLGIVFLAGVHLLPVGNLSISSTVNWSGSFSCCSQGSSIFVKITRDYDAVKSHLLHIVGKKNCCAINQLNSYYITF